MAVDLTQEVSDRLASDHSGWLTTVARSGQPVPRLVWFYFDGGQLIVYSRPDAAKVRHLRERPAVSVNLDSDGNGGGVVVVGGQAQVDATGVDCREDGPYWQKYREDADRFGLTDSLGEYSTRLVISVDKVWTTPASG